MFSSPRESLFLWTVKAKIIGTVLNKMIVTIAIILEVDVVYENVLITSIAERFILSALSYKILIIGL